MDGPGESRALADDLVVVARGASAIDLRSFEQRDAAALHAELVPRVLGLVESGLEVMSRALELHEEAGSGPEADEADERPAREPVASDEPPVNFLVRIDRVLGTSDRSAHVADLAFMARMELRDTVQMLESLGPDDDRWRVLALCDSCLRGLRKASSAVERALGDHAGFEPRLELVTELHLGRVIRAYYARFRREIEAEGVPTAAEVHRRLLSAAASIAKLIGRDFYGDLRVDDRAQLRSLQERIRDWLAGADDHDPESGVRLWQDLQGFTVLLFQINRRSELVEHDRTLVAAALDQLTGRGEVPEEVPPDLLRRFDRLRGRSDRIDRLLAEPVTRATGPWLVALQQVSEKPGLRVDRRRLRIDDLYPGRRVVMSRSGKPRPTQDKENQG